MKKIMEDLRKQINTYQLDRKKNRHLYGRLVWITINSSFYDSLV